MTPQERHAEQLKRKNALFATIEELTGHKPDMPSIVGAMLADLINAQITIELLEARIRVLEGHGRP